MKSIGVNLDREVSASYQIHIGQDILDRMGLLMAKGNWASRYAIVTDSRVAALYGERVLHVLREMNLKVDLGEFLSGATSKGLETCLEVIRWLMALGADRTWGLMALGGGAIGDITGFVASVYMRGIPYVQIPTTLLAQVDSSIGGKTGIDLPEGKNLLGTFKQPKAVFIDLAFLKTLSPREFRDGLAEIVKYGLIDDPWLLSRLEAASGAIERQDTGFLEEIVSRSCQIKKAIVEMDETEKGLRRILNFGHTLGHAMEAASGYSLSHGEAVSLGAVASAVISERLGHLPIGELEQIISLMKGLGLPHRIPSALSTEAILSHLARDKKKEGDTLHFVLLKKIGFPFVNGSVPEALLRETLEGLKR